MKIREYTGKTTQEAIDAGLAELGVTIADVHVDVLQEGAKGLFGLFGSKPAKVRLTVMEDEKEDDAGLGDLLGSFSLDEPRKPKKQEKKPEKKPEKKQESKPEPKAEEAKPAPEKKAEEPRKPQEPKRAPEKRPAEGKTPDAQAQPAAEKPRAPRAKKPRAPRAERPQEPKREATPMEPSQVFVPTEPPTLHDEQTPAGRAQRFLMDVTKLMGVEVDVYVDDSKEGALSIRVIGDTLGILIGRRGETLDALQYLTSLQVNKGREEYIRVTLDTESYRAKREDSLRRLANRMANRAVKTGRRVVLEPMNPYERRVLHTALQDHPEVATHSEGEEPNRRVVITLKALDNAPAQAKPQEREEDGERPAAPKRKRHHRGSRKPKAPREDGPVSQGAAKEEPQAPAEQSAQPQEATEAAPQAESPAEE